MGVFCQWLVESCHFICIEEGTHFLFINLKTKKKSSPPYLLKIGKPNIRWKWKDKKIVILFLGDGLPVNAALMWWLAGREREAERERQGERGRERESECASGHPEGMEKNDILTMAAEQASVPVITRLLQVPGGPWNSSPPPQTFTHKPIIWSSITLSQLNELLQRQKNVNQIDVFLFIYILLWL